MKIEITPFKKLRSGTHLQAHILIDGIPAGSLMKDSAGGKIVACGLVALFTHVWYDEDKARADVQAHLAEGVVPPLSVGLADLVNLSKNGCLKFKNTTGAAISVSTLDDIIRHLRDGSLNLELPKERLQ